MFHLFQSQTAGLFFFSKSVQSWFQHLAAVWKSHVLLWASVFSSVEWGYWNLSQKVVVKIQRPEWTLSECKLLLLKLLFFKMIAISGRESWLFDFSTSWWGFPYGSAVRLSHQWRRHSFNPWVRKIPWRRKRQPTPVFLPGKSHRQRSRAGYSPTSCKESDTTEWLSMHTFRDGNRIFSWTHSFSA